MHHSSITVANAAAISFRLPIPGLDGYEADDAGNIYSTRSGNLRKLRPTLDPTTGYLKVLIYRHGEPRRNRYVHHLIALTFHGDRPADMLVCHTPDPRKTNNRAENLRYQTRLENAADSRRDGTLPHAKRKLDYTKAEEIRRLDDAGITTAEIARRFNVSRDCVRKVVTWRSWRGQRG